jgi:hypothetical protein
VKFRIFLLTALFGVLAWQGQGVEPPLPGEDGPRPAADVFKPLLQPGDELPPGSEAPVMPELPTLMPPELYPEAMPGSDGVDGLPAGASAGGSDLAPLPSAEPPLLPPPAGEAAPAVELATRAYWHRSPREARETSKQEQKPLLLFFYQKWSSAPGGAAAAQDGETKTTDNNLTINDDLLATPEFNEYAAGHMVLTRLFYPRPTQEKAYPKEQIAALKQFRNYFKVKVLPTILLLDENGKEIERISGYSRIKDAGNIEMSGAQVILERLQRAVERREAVITAANEKRERLKAQNYREWTSKAGTKLFAKLVSVSPEGVVLRDEAGALRQVQPELLWIVDQAWIRRQVQNGSVVRN